MAAALVPLANLTLGSSQATVTFSSIDQGYRDLFISIVGGGSVAGQLYFRLNGDTGSNYSLVYMEGYYSYIRGTYVGGISYASIGWGDNWWQTSGSNCQINIMDYSATDKFKSSLSRGNGNTSAVDSVANLWNSTAAVTSVAISNVNGGTFNSGTSFALYGVKA